MPKIRSAFPLKSSKIEVLGNSSGCAIVHSHLNLLNWRSQFLYSSSPEGFFGKFLTRHYTSGFEVLPLISLESFELFGFCRTIYTITHLYDRPCCCGRSLTNLSTSLNHLGGCYMTRKIDICWSVRAHLNHRVQVDMDWKRH